MTTKKRQVSFYCTPEIEAKVQKWKREGHIVSKVINEAIKGYSPEGYVPNWLDRIRGLEERVSQLEGKIV